MNQGSGENRSLDETLGLAWQVLGVLPRRELTMLPAGHWTSTTRPARPVRMVDGKVQRAGAAPRLAVPPGRAAGGSG